MRQLGLMTLLRTLPLAFLVASCSSKGAELCSSAHTQQEIANYFLAAATLSDIKVVYAGSSNAVFKCSASITLRKSGAQVATGPVTYQILRQGDGGQATSLQDVDPNLHEFINKLAY